MTSLSDKKPAGFVLEARGVSKSFGAYLALKDVDFAVGQGEVTALAGPNGAGKTTLFHVLDGNLRPDSGRVKLYGRDVTGFAPWRRARLGLGRLFQDARVFGELTAKENVAAALMSSGSSGDEAGRWLDFAGISAMADKKAGVLAPVERRLLAIARLLALKSGLFLLDEPAASLPEDEKNRIYGFVRRLVDERKSTVVMVEHDMDIVRRFADSVFFLHEGRVLCTGRTGEVFDDDRVRALYSAAGEMPFSRDCGPVRFVESFDALSDEFGRPPADVACLRREGNVFPSLSVADKLALGGWKASDADFALRRKRALGLFPFLAERLRQRAGTLSGGQRQALAIAMTMCRPARVYFFDGPSAGLAPNTASDMFAAIRRFAEEERDCRVLVSESGMYREGR